MNNRIYIAASDARKRLLARLHTLQQQHVAMNEENSAARKAGKPLPHSPAALRNIWCKRRSVGVQLGKLDAIEKLKSQVVQLPGASVEIDRDASRVRFRFDRMPIPRVAVALRRRGFLWSAENIAWQRRLSQEAIKAAEEVVAIIREAS